MTRIWDFSTADYIIFLFYTRLAFSYQRKTPQVGLFQSLILGLEILSFDIYRSLIFCLFDMVSAVKKASSVCLAPHWLFLPLLGADSQCKTKQHINSSAQLLGLLLPQPLLTSHQHLQSRTSHLQLLSSNTSSLWKHHLYCTSQSESC